jgi:hypothetical protein
VARDEDRDAPDSDDRRSMARSRCRADHLLISLDMPTGKGLQPGQKLNYLTLPIIGPAERAEGQVAICRLRTTLGSRDAVARAAGNVTRLFAVRSRNGFLRDD